MNSDTLIVTLTVLSNIGTLSLQHQLLFIFILPLFNRHVILPPPCAEFLPKDKLFTEAEWRLLGVVQSPGWVHYAHHKPEPHILLFRRQLDA